MLHASQHNSAGLSDRATQSPANRRLDPPRQRAVARRWSPARRPAPPSQRLRFKISAGPVLVLRPRHHPSGLVDAVRRDEGTRRWPGRAAPTAFTSTTSLLPRSACAGPAPSDALPDGADRSGRRSRPHQAVTLNGRRAHLPTSDPRPRRIPALIPPAARAATSRSPCPDYDVFSTEQAASSSSTPMSSRLVVQALDLSERRSRRDRDRNRAPRGAPHRTADSGREYPARLPAQRRVKWAVVIGPARLPRPRRLRREEPEEEGAYAATAGVPVPHPPSSTRPSSASPSSRAAASPARHHHQHRGLRRLRRGRRADHPRGRRDSGAGRMQLRSHVSISGLERQLKAASPPAFTMTDAAPRAQTETLADACGRAVHPDTPSTADRAKVRPDRPRRRPAAGRCSCAPRAPTAEEVRGSGEPLDDLRLLADVQTGNIEILDRATPPSSPRRASRARSPLGICLLQGSSASP